MLDGKLSVAEAIATMGIVLSLLFVGFEIRQSNLIARQEAIQSLASDVNNAFLVAAESEYLSGISQRILIGEGPSKFEAAESTSGYFYLLQFVVFYNQIYNLTTLGIVKEEDFFYPVQGHPFFSSEFAHEVWPLMRVDLNPDFAEFWESRLGLLEPPADK